MDFIPIIHRINTLDDLETIPFNYGVEIDIRYENNDLYLSHDPINDLSDKCRLVDFLSEFNHKFIVANIKDSGVETLVIETIKRKTENFFLLDFEIPFLFNKNENIKNFLSARYSNFEQIYNDSLVV